ncbi:MAG: tetratricopeptide repeat protein [Deltaproteobacteria bacterium]|nr:MAG: tetratricopeptide repeat protein [Deltaproteobacteria bacterium]
MGPIRSPERTPMSDPSLRETLELRLFAILRIARAGVTGGDVYDARVISASDLTTLGQPHRAIAVLDRLVAASPERPRAWFERGIARMELDQDALALEDLQHCLELDPDFPGARQWLEIARKALQDNAPENRPPTDTGR